METIKSWFASSTIKSEIMKLLNGKIALAEQDFKAGVEEIKVQLQMDIETAEAAAESDTKTLVENLVKKVISDLTN